MRPNTALIMTACLMLLALTGCAAAEEHSPAVSPSSDPSPTASQAPPPEAASATSESFAAVLACMETAGWEVVAVGAEQFTVPGQTPEQTPAIREDYQSCSASTGWSAE
ncbi:hypothetical protein [Agromyces sp. NPDC058110]|uniref:hypothetical protein n=1 Tax=Agromyces sp. NPDC058110 TaxID=3346345 RepID=UPI0036D9D813